MFLNAISLFFLKLMKYRLLWRFLILIESQFQETLPLYVRSGGLNSGFHFGGLAVRTFITIAIPMSLAILAQRYIVQGLTLGAVKG